MHIRMFLVPLLVVFTPKANISFGLFKVIPCLSQKGLGGIVGEPQHLAFKSYWKKYKTGLYQFFGKHKQQSATEKSTKLRQRKGSGIANNPKCVGVGKMVGGVQCV